MYFYNIFNWETPIAQRLPSQQTPPLDRKTRERPPFGQRPPDRDPFLDRDPLCIEIPSPWHIQLECILVVHCV